MTDKGVLDLVEQCNIEEGIELVPGKAYLFKQKFCENYFGKVEYVEEEIIILTKSGIKAGGIYRMGPVDVHWVIIEEYRGQHILSDFLKTDIIREIWPENTSTELCGVDTQDEYDKKRYLAELCHMSIKNEEQIENCLTS